MGGGCSKGMEESDSQSAIVQLQEAFYDLENTNQDIKRDLKDLYINSAIQIDVSGGKKAVVIHIPYRLRKAFRKIHSRLVRELEKKFSGKGIWLNFPKDQLFCLLGPNGAGKTTAINCLTGITPVTSGDALIYGNSIRSSTGMSNIWRMIGVCPQFDVLWDALSGQEHLYLFASIKCLTPASIKSDVDKLLAEVKLTEAAKVFLDPKVRNDSENKLETFAGVYRKLSWKDVVFEFPILEAF